MNVSIDRSSMHILAVGRPDAQAAPGGGEVQMTSTVAALRELGVDARTWCPDEGDLRSADCLHLFGSRPEHLPLVEAARRRGMPIVLSTIAWFDWIDYWREGKTPIARMTAVARFAARAVCPRLPSWRRRLYHSVDLLLPNSTAEADQLIRYFGVPSERIRVVPNGAAPRFAQCDGRLFVERYGVENFVLCPGRVEPRKNQLGLIRAMRDSGVPLVVLGQAVPGHEAYYEACRREADENVRFIDRIEHDDPALAAAYAACGCLALASWFETPSLAALEAGMSGVPLVLPEGGCAREYFGHHAQYVKPNDYRGIRRAVAEALAQERSQELAEHVQKHFTWNEVAAATREAYASAISLKKNHAGGAILRGAWAIAKRWPRIQETGPSLRSFPGTRCERIIIETAPENSSIDITNSNAARLQRQTLGRYRYVRLRWRILFALIDFFGNLIFRLGRRMRRKSSDVKDPRTILIVQLDHLGDAILSTGMINVLRRLWPEASIEVLTGQWNEKLFRAIDGIDKVHVSRINRFSRSGRFGWPVAIFWWGWFLRHRKIDLGIDVRGEFPLALLLWLAGARRRLGWAAGGGGFLLTDSPRFVPNRPEVESRGALLAELDIEIERPDELLPVFHPPAHARRTVEQQLDREGLRGPFIVLHISAGTAAKQWPIEHWQALLGRLIVEHGHEVVLVGSQADRIIARSILAGKTWPGVHDWTGRCDIVELAALLERAELIVGADSGPVHMAAAVDRPVVVLFSGTNRHEQWQPCGSAVCVLRCPVACSPCHRSSCPLTDHPCMNGLRPELVVEAVVARLKERNILTSHDCPNTRIEHDLARPIPAERGA